ncbi:MAG: FKBP-type peptidyl-prolyl cis-trans isomerase [Candidatus Aenigmarchaeota archaeon]|nr:FKBP-type peptidyl-prolyl cis-trans isomerase [Candidatus Aenigmarchaeota archaeon]
MKKGDFVKLEYTGRVKDTKEIFDTTEESLAKENNIFKEDTKYGAVSIIVGAGYVVSGLDKKLLEVDANATAKADISQEDGFGKRDASLIKIMPSAHFQKEKIVPVPGQYITLGNNVSGKILSASSGRVRVDFNHPLAGKILEYEIKTLGIITAPKEKINVITGFYFGGLKEKIASSLSEGHADISMPKEFFKFVPDDLRKKIENDIKKHVEGVKEVSFSEQDEKDTQTAAKETPK